MITLFAFNTFALKSYTLPDTCVFTTTDFSCALFKLEESKLTAKEGSCIEIKCTVLKNINHVGLYWFWMKNANWNEDLKDFNATIIYSTNNSLRPVSPDFADRVHYTGSPFSSWRNSYRSTPKCSILICNLNKTDSGNYSFRYVGSVSSEKWKTNVVNLTVEGKHKDWLI